MANIAQATFEGGDVFIQCNPKWDCCQRAQAQRKVEALNNACDPAKGGPLKVRGKLSKATNRVKKRAQDRASRAMDRKSPADRAKGVQPLCLAEKLKDKTRKGAKVEMDHPVDTKWGGASDPGGLEPVDRKVNGAMGTIAKNVGNDMRKARTDKSSSPEVTSVSLICPPSAPGCPGPPQQDFSGGARKSWPAPPTNVVRTRKY